MMPSVIGLHLLRWLLIGQNSEKHEEITIPFNWGHGFRFDPEFYPSNSMGLEKRWDSPLIFQATNRHNKNPVVSFECILPNGCQNH
jgi:hypothetical protein